jgi:Catalytic LigB subunit of aromatic ring-opening dioxygenase
MARIVLGLGTSHSPQLSTPPEVWPVHAQRDKVSNELFAIDGSPLSYAQLLTRAPPSIHQELSPEKWQARFEACQRAIAKEAEIVARVMPDVLIMVGDDQQEVIKNDNVPAILVYWGKTIPHVPRSLIPALQAAAWAYGEEEKEYPVASTLGRHLIESLMEQKFDVAQSQFIRAGQGMGHAFSFVYRRILNNKPIPSIPIMLNTYYPPNQPSAERCYELGKALRQAIGSWNSDIRVAIIASGGLSHFVLDEELDTNIIKAMQKKDERQLRSLPGERLKSGTSEVRNWIVIAGAAEYMEMHLIDYAPCYRSAAGTGVGMAFAEWS